MSKQHDLKVSLFDMITSCKHCLKHIEGITFEEFERDAKTMHAVQHQLQVLGEATKRIDNEFRKNNPEIPWKEMAELFLFQLFGFPDLRGASQDELNHFELSPSGYGIHWPNLDEDISINSFLS
jgi:hypothetical protein